MNKIHLASRVAALFFLLSGLGAHAEDVDIYSNNAYNSAVPNVLIVLDNAANFSASAGSCAYTYRTDGVTPDGAAPSLNGTAGGIEQCALYNVVNKLPVGAINLGVMVYNGNNIRDYNIASDTAGSNCMGSEGGCLMVPLTLMSSTSKVRFLNWVKSWTTSGGASTAYIKANGEATGATMQEAWAYYAGRVGLSGRNYASVQPPAGCQKNFVIFIGNAFNTSGTPGDGGSASPSAALVSASGAAVSAITIPSGSYGSSSFSCGAYTMGNHTDGSGLYADEWARYMYKQADIYSTLDGSQSITTYTVGLLGASCKPDYPALMTSMAKEGGGKYYATSSYEEIANAILSILNEVQAVNSVFASASLPVSVNAQGTYLNQIFLGMFRPDAAANPRWLGNLKQYQFILTYLDPTRPDPNTATLQLGDANGNPAISSAGTGFISANAVSYWTSKNTATSPDSLGGFWVNDPHGAGGGYDSPDGELVEKGGAAQVTRKTNLTATFSGPMSSANPRKLYTYCPSGAGCVSDLSDASNSFTTDNTGIPSSAFGSGNSVRISSIVRTGTTATVTTAINHGFSNGSTVSIINASPNDYNVTQAISAVTANTFQISGLQDFPSSPSSVAFTATDLSGGAISITSITRSSSSTNTADTETATVTTSTLHGLTTGDKVTISGASPTVYNGTFTVTVINSTQFSYTVGIDPVRTAVNTYSVAVSPANYPAQGVSLSKTSGNIRGVTVNAHNLHTGQRVVISGTSGIYDGACVATVVNTTTFTCGGIAGNPPSANGYVSPDATAQTLSGVSRTGGTVVNSTATATGAPAGWLGTKSGDTKVVNIAQVSGAGTSESAYVVSSVTITCGNTDCTQFSYPITVSPAITASGTMTATRSGTLSYTIPAGSITRSGATATVSGVSNAFLSGQQISMSSSTAGAEQSAYIGVWTITCPVSCATAFTFGPVTQTPSTPATGANMQAYSGSAPVDAPTLIRWVRGENNAGDEAGPGGSVTVRGSVHGDVLHSRPAVVNYGDSRGLVVFYGSNDGIFRAINGSQTASIGAVPPGGELWGLILAEHFGQLNRQRLNTPELKTPSTLLDSAKPKDYAVDGAPGSYQLLKADGSIDKAYLYLTMRRGGQFLYAVDVSDPLRPTLLWQISSTDVFSELGQTWSRPRVTLIKGYSSPVLIFGAGYDLAEDAEPPGAGTVGRGIFVVDALTGKLIWRVTPTSSVCTGNNVIATGGACLVQSDMLKSIPADLTFVDRNNDGYTDRLYAVDVGGNIWRVDLEPAVGQEAPANWLVTKLAALGCGTGPCASGTTPRKFFYPPDVVSVGATGSSGSYDMVLVGSGDREHPLKLTDASGNVLPGTSFAVANRFYAIKDPYTGMNASSSTTATEANLFDATSTPYNGSGRGFYVTFAAGEKAVNSSVTVRGITYFGTNKPTPPATNTCQSNLGEAKGYALDPFTGTFSSNVFDGGGLPPSPTTGVVSITLADGRIVQKEFCIGCVGTGSDSRSSVGVADTGKSVPKALKRTYWYRQ